MNYAIHQKGSAFAVGQVVHVKGAWDTGASCCFSRNRPKTSRLLAKWVCTSCTLRWGAATWCSRPATTCSTSISNRKPHADQLFDFLSATKANPSYPARSDQITSEAHGFHLMSDLKRSGEEFVREVLGGAQTLGDKNCMLLDDLSATTASRGREKQSSSQSALFTSESR